jgi:hypothetical protein
MVVRIVTLLSVGSHQLMCPKVEKNGFGAGTFSGWTSGGDFKREAMTGCCITASSIWIHLGFGLAVPTRSCSSHSCRLVCISCYGQGQWRCTVVSRCCGRFASESIFFSVTVGTKSLGGCSSPSRADEEAHSGLCCQYHWNVLFLSSGSVSCMGPNLWMQMDALLLEVALEG